MRGKPDTHQIAATAARQKGLVKRAQVVAAGGSRRFIDTKIAAGWLHPRHTGVYAVGHPALTPQARWLAAVYALGDDAVLSVRAAGQSWAILRGHHHLDVTVPRTSGLADRDGITVHRQPLSPHEITTRHGIPTTTLTRTLIDLAAVLTSRELADAFEEAQVRHRLRPARLAVEVVARRGHRGNAKLRALLDGAVDPGQVESHLELRFLKLCRDHSLPRPLQQVWIGAHRADFLYRDERLVIETDGVRFHASAGRRRRDAAKTAALDAEGYELLRMHWADVVHAPETTAAEVRAALARATRRR